MRPAASVEQMLAAPVGHYLSGGFYLGWVHSPSLIGTVYFGRPSAKDFPALLPLFQLPGHPALRAPYDVLVDCRRLEALSPDALEFLLQYLDSARRFSARMRKVAIVRPSGHPGIVLAGVFYELVRSSFVAALFADAAEAPPGSTTEKRRRLSPRWIGWSTAFAGLLPSCFVSESCCRPICGGRLSREPRRSCASRRALFSDC